MTRGRRLMTTGLAMLGALSGGVVAWSAPAFAAPETPVTEAAKEVTGTSAVLHGEVNPGVEAAAGYYFSYNTNGKCTEGLTTEPGVEAVVKALKVSTLVTGLEPDREYMFCVVATHLEGETTEATSGSALPFKTLAVKPAVDSESASGVKATEATLEAQVNANNQATSYAFEYSAKATGEVLEGTVTKVTGASPLAAEFGDRTASIPTGAVLKEGETYHYRVVAENEQSQTEGPSVKGALQEFTTVPAPFTDEVKPVGTTTATLKAHLKPLNPTVATQYSFDYNFEECDNAFATPAGEAGTAPGTEVAESAEVAELQPNKLYTVCFITANAFGSEQGPPVQFTTLPAPPSIDSENASSAGNPSAILEAQVNPNNQETKYSFQYATNPALTGATTVPGGSALAGFGDQPGSVNLGSGLPPGIYYYRAVAENQQSEVEGKPVEGEIKEFARTAPPIASADEAQSATVSSVVLSGTVNPQGADTTYRFELVSEAEYQAALAGSAEDPYAAGPSTTATDAGSDYTNHATGAVLVGGLLPSTTYRYTLVATNEKGARIAPGGTFTTGEPPTPLGASTGAASSVAQNTATITATINTEGLPTTYGFEIGPQAGNYGPPTGLGSVGAGASQAEVALALTGLLPGTTYHYRITATNIDGTREGEDRTFTTSLFTNAFATPPAPLPFVAVPAITFPTGTEANTATTKTTPKALTNTQKLTKALKACKKQPKKKQAKCKAKARKKYTTAKKKK